MAASTHRECVSVRLRPEPAGRTPGRTLIVPFDRLQPHDGRGGTWQRVGLGVAARAIASRVIDGSQLRGAPQLHAGLAIPPWQLLVPSLVAAGATRVLLADAVGLGKTVQAGFTIAAVHGFADRPRTLVLTPAALCDQWAAELTRLFGWPVDVMDAAALRRARRDAPPGVNLWALPGTAVASIDFVKQAEVLSGVLAASWELLVVDEAHHLSPGTDRYEAAHAIATRVPLVLLLTATPHAGSDEAYDALRRLGATAHEPPAVFLRRTRSQTGLASRRRVARLACAASPAERRLWDALRRYALAVWARGAGPARLAMTVLLKRAASSAVALRRSLAHRRLSIAGSPQPLQSPLPFELDPGEHDPGDDALDASLAVPGLTDTRREAEWLLRLECLAEAALGAEGKLKVLQRLLRRVHEPLVVFTEFRDTLEHAAAIIGSSRRSVLLHGGLSRSERRDAERAFARGDADVLLATDVGSEGLNLQHAARLVVSIEVPWSPSRLEQRIGRVDRIGQSRAVHGVMLVASAGPECDVLRHLGDRIARIGRALGDTVELPHDDERIAAAALGVPAAPRHPPARAPAPLPTRAETCEVDVTMLSCARALLHAAAPAATRFGRFRRRSTTPWARLRGSGMPPGVVFVFEVQALTDAGTVAATALVPVHVGLGQDAFQHFRPAALVRGLERSAAEAAARAARTRLIAGLAIHQNRTGMLLDRLVALQAAQRETADPQVQPGLFDRRALAAAARRHAAAAERQEDLATRVERLRSEQLVGPPGHPRAVAAFVVR